MHESWVKFSAYSLGSAGTGSEFPGFMVQQIHKSPVFQQAVFFVVLLRVALRGVHVSLKDSDLPHSPHSPQTLNLESNLNEL